ncbi:MAG: tetratricopeptide repeat protein, partial [Bacteroidota bacterium]
MKNILLIFFFMIISQLAKAQDTYNELKTQYDSLRKVENHEGALLVAKQMNAWALKNETDTSLRYAVSLRYVGNCYMSFEKYDSSIIFYNNVLQILEKQGRKNDVDYTETLNSLGISYKHDGEFKKAEESYLKAIDIRNQYPKSAGYKPRYLNNLGYLYVSMGLYDQAEEKIIEALSRFRAIYPSPDDSIKFIYIVHSLASVKIAEKNYYEADTLLRKWLAVVERQKDYKKNELLNG